MSLTSGLTPSRRLTLGVIVLLLVDVIWVLSAELTGYTFKEFNKPFFTTYVKTSMFMLYMLGFLFWKPWQKQCMECMQKANKPRDHHLIVTSDNSSSEEDLPEDHTLSEPLYVPVKFDDDKLSSRSESISDSCEPPKHVRFSNLMEVRQLSEKEAHEAVLARLSYSASLRAQQEQEAQLNSKLSVPQIAKVSLMFCLVWFLGNLSYQEAIDDTQVAVVQVFSSTSGLFTLILAAIFPSSNGDKFTLSKLFAVLLSLGGIAVISLSGTGNQDHFKLGSLWALLGAVLYAIYMVMLKKKVDNEDRLDIPMFFGFVGLFNFLIIWPGFFIMSNFHLELFELPTRKVWCYILVNGLVGTVVSEFLWLWGCFLTSSLIATLSLSLTIPLSVIADIILNDVEFNWMFFAGAGPVFLSFIAVSILNHYNDWDPIWVGICKLLGCIRSLVAAIFQKRSQIRLPGPEDREQKESLISVNDVENDSDSIKCCAK